MFKYYPLRQKYKYYASGKEISLNEHRNILNGKTEKSIRCPGNQPGACLAWIADHINTINDMLDESDPLLLEVLDVLGLPLEKTYIIQIDISPTDLPDPLTDNKKAAVYGYW